MPSVSEFLSFLCFFNKTCTAFLMNIYFCQHSNGCRKTKQKYIDIFFCFTSFSTFFLSVRKASMPVFHSYLKLKTLFSFYSAWTIPYHQLSLLVSWFLFPKFSLILNKAQKITISKTLLRRSILLQTFYLRNLLTSNTDFQYQDESSVFSANPEKLLQK